MFNGGTLISADDTWVLMAITFGFVALAIYLEQNFEWASKLSGAIIALLGALILTNLHIIPTSAPFFDTVSLGIRSTDGNSSSSSAVQHEEDLERFRQASYHFLHRGSRNCTRRARSVRRTRPA